MEQFKAVQIGCGARGPAHSKALQDIAAYDFVATCDLDQKKAKDIASKFGASNFYTDFHEMMKKEKPDVIGIVTEPGVRSDLVIPLLQYKPKAIVIEKPFAITLLEAEKMVNACNDAGTYLVICHECRYSDEMQKLRDLIAQGKFGKIQKVLANCKMNLIAQGTHIIDLIGMMLPEYEPRWVLGQVDGANELFKKLGDRIWHSPHAVHPSSDHAIVQIGYDDGITAFASIGNRSPDVPECNDYTLEFQIAVIGEKGYGEATLSKEWNAYIADGSTDSGKARFFDVDSYMTIGLYKELVDVLEGKITEHQTSGNVALKVQRIINAVNESVLQNRAIQIPYWPFPGTLPRIRNRIGAQRNLVVSTLMFPNHTRKEILEPIAKAGFQEIDLWMVPGWAEHLTVDDDIAKVKEELQMLGLKVPVISYYDQAPVDKKLKIAAELGAKIAVSGGFNAKKDLKKVQSLKSELDLAYDLGIRIAYENHYGELNTIQDMKDFLEALDYHPAAYICLAPTHLALYSETVEDALYELRERIGVCYIWDVEVYTTLEEADLSKPDNWWENGVAQTPGASDMDFRSYLTAAVRYAPEALWALTYHGTYKWDLKRIIGSLKQSARVVDRNRPLNVNSIFLRHIK